MKDRRVPSKAFLACFPKTACACTPAPRSQVKVNRATPHATRTAPHRGSRSRPQHDFRYHIRAPYWAESPWGRRADRTAHFGI
jgi:hypothetical protein